MTAQELFEIGMAYERMGKMDHALRSYSSIIAQWPHEIAPYHRLSVIALEQRDPSLALVWIEKALAIDNDVVGLWNNRALALAELARFDEAHSSFERAIELNKNNWEAYYNLGRMLLVQKRYAEAEAPLRQAAEIDPNSADTFNNLGLVLHQLYRYEEACDAFDRAIALKPDYIETISNKGASLYFSHRFPEAEDTFNKAIAIAPDSTAGVRYNLACLKMCQGRLKEGLEEYEWRWKTPEWVPPRKYFGRPLWRGNTLRGETILVWHEQGLGDTIQFVRYIHDLAKQDCEIVVEVQPQLYRLLTASFSLPNVKFIRAGATPPTFDLHVPMISLARILGITYESMPAIKPYVRPRGREIEDWRGKLKTLTLPENRRKKRIGIAWYGNPSHPGDRNRSMFWEAFSPLITENKDRFQFFSLQPGGKPEDPDIIDLGDSLTDFAITAAIVTNLDLVISVDTSLVHLAGALGKRVWTLLFYTPDWRWVIGDERTKWYPSMSLFWQKKPGEWYDVIQEVTETLALE